MNKLRVFYVDDDEIHCRVVARMLADDPRFAVATYRSAVEMLARLELGEQCDILITDCNMPEMNGNDLVGSVRSLQGSQNVRILMLTVNNEWQDVARSLQVGANEYLMKPFNKEMLVNKLDLLLAQ